METKVMAAILNDNVIDKVVGRKKKEKVKPKEFGVDDFHSISPDNMKQVLRGLNDVLEIVETAEIDSVAAMRIKRRIEVVEDILCQKLKQIENPESQEIKDEELLRQLIEMQRASHTNTQTWINTNPGTINPTTIVPYVTTPYTGGGGSGSIIWPTMDTTDATPVNIEDISGWGGLLPKDDDE